MIHPGKIACGLRESVGQAFGLPFVAPPRGARTTPPAVLPLYTRAADMVEVATVIHLGRSVDLTG